MILGNCDYYQSFVDIAKYYFCGFFTCVSFLFALDCRFESDDWKPFVSTVPRHYNFFYIGGCLCDLGDVKNKLRYID
jgi:hypothetical protein